MYLLTHASIVASLGNFYDVTRAVGEKGDKYFMSSEEGKNIMYRNNEDAVSVHCPKGYRFFEI